MLHSLFLSYYIASCVSAQSNSNLLPPLISATGILPPFQNSSASTQDATFSPTAFFTTHGATTTTRTAASTTSTYASPRSTKPLPTLQTCPTSNGTTVTTFTGQKFLLECDIDHPRGDFKSIRVSSLVACIVECDATDGCVDVSFSGSTCYLKSILLPGVYSPGLSGARLVGVEAPTRCPEDDGKNFTTPLGRVFEIECGIDHAGGDMGSLQMESSFGETWLQDCVEACGNVTGCVDVSLSGSACYLKSSVGPSQANSGVSGARLLYPLPVPEEEICDTNSPTCPACNNTILHSLDSEPEKAFRIECGVDRPGGDMPSQVNEHTGLRGPRAFRNCLEDCAEVEGCVDVSLLNGVCYLKDKLEVAVDQPLVWGARLLE